MMLTRKAAILTSLIGASLLLTGCTGKTGSDGDGTGEPAGVKSSTTVTAPATVTPATTAPSVAASPEVTFGPDLNNAALRANGSTSFTFTYPQAGVTISPLMHGGSDSKLVFTVSIGGKIVMAETVAARNNQYNFFLPAGNSKYVGKTAKVAFHVTGSKTEFGAVVAYTGSSGN